MSINEEKLENSETVENSESTIEKVEEPKVEEVKAEQKVEETTPNTSTPIELKKYTSDEKNYADVVEELRVNIVKQNKKSTVISSISIFVVFGLIAAGIILMTKIQWLSYVLLGVAIVILLTMSIIVKKVTQPDIKGYIREGSTAVNRYIFNDTQYSDCYYDINKKIVFGEICEDGVYKEIKECVSRDVVDGVFAGRSFKVAELGIYKQQVKRAKPTAFVGKYLTFPNSLHFVDRIVIVSKGLTEVDIPDGVEDLEQEASEDGKFVIFAPKGVKAKEVLGQKFIDNIKKIKVENHLLTLTVVVWAGRTVVYASYDDESVTLPFQSPIDKSCFAQYKGDLLDELKALSLLNKE